MALRKLFAALHDEGGQVLVLAVLGMTALLGMSSITIDLGVAMAQRRSAQSIADAAALAGAVDLPGVTEANAQAVTDATTAANTNLASTGISGATVTVNSPPVNSASHNGDTSSVEVTISANAPTFFAGVLNLGPFGIKAHAVATGAGSLGTPPIVILDPAQADSLDIGEDPGTTLSSKYQPSGGDNLACATSGTNTVQINGPIYTNSVASDGEEVHAGCDLSAASNHSAGDDQALCSDDTCGQFTPPPTEGTGTQFPDPLAYLTEPSSVTSIGTVVSDTKGYCSSGNPPSCIVTGSGSVTVGPGVWNNLEVTGSGTLTLNAGVYVITGSVQLTGTQGSSNTGSASGTLKGVGVTLYFTCTSSSAPYWTDCPSGGGTWGQSGNSQCPNNCTGTSTSSCPNKCSPGGFLNIQAGTGGTFNLQSPSSGSTQGLLVFYDRNNYIKRSGDAETDETFNMEVIGAGGDTMNGTIYGERSDAWIISRSNSFSMNSCIVINSLGIYGPKNYTLSCTPTYNAIPSNVPYGGASLTE